MAPEVWGSERGVSYDGGGLHGGASKQATPLVRLPGSDE